MASFQYAHSCMRQELLDLTLGLRRQLQSQLNTTPWLQRAPLPQREVRQQGLQPENKVPIRSIEPQKKPTAAITAREVTKPVEAAEKSEKAPPSITETPKVASPKAPYLDQRDSAEKPLSYFQESQLQLKSLQPIVARVAPQLPYLETVPTEALPRCLLLDTGLSGEERIFLERLAQALTARVAPARLVPVQKLSSWSRPPVRLLIAYQGSFKAPVDLPLIQLESPAHYNDKTAKVALWKQLCQHLEK